MPISKPHSTMGADNKGSCSDLAFYLEKENEDLDRLSKKYVSMNDVSKIELRKQGFFSHSESNISTIEVINAIDNNRKKLGAKDAKYFAPTISFSENELNHIAFLATGKNDIKSVWDMNIQEVQKFNDIIREYGRKVMDNYAQNFNRTDKGINSGADLVYFGKIEHFRKFKGTDKDVVNGKEKAGKYKQGLQSHIHCIVARKDRTQRLKLSPTCNEINTERAIGNNSYKVGFDRVKWIDMNEKTFDEHFRYERTELEKFRNQNILKNGSPQEKYDLNILLKSNQTNFEAAIDKHQKLNTTQIVQDPAGSKEKTTSTLDDFSNDVIVTQENTSEFENYEIADADKKKKRKNIKTKRKL